MKTSAKYFILAVVP